MRATAAVAFGLAALLEDHIEHADAAFARAVDVCLAGGAYPGATVALAGRALVAIDASEWFDASGYVERALAVIEDHGLQGYLTSALSYAIAARVALQHGDRETASDHVTAAIRLRPILTYAYPVLSLEALLQLAEADLLLADSAGARSVMRQVRDILRQRPALESLAKRADALHDRLDSIATSGLGATTLSAAELRLLPYLATHLTFGDIAERRFVSRNTVKTQAASIYRKLGVTSRTEAVERCVSAGLLS
jgi:LuxR family maltose regulon positive regulatory protein